MFETPDINDPFWTHVNPDNLYIEVLYKRATPYNPDSIRVPDQVLDDWVALGNSKMFLDANYLKAVRDPTTNEIQIALRDQYALLVPQPTQEPVQEPTQEPVQESVQEPVQESVQEPIQESVQESVQEPTQEPIQESVQEPVQESVQEPTQQ